MRAFVKHDLDGFFGLFIDNLVQLLLIVSLCGALCGMTGEDARLIHERILPGAAVSILLGNLFYAWQAHRVAAREGRDDVTALPYGINTPSLLVYVFFVMAPVFRATGSAEAAWRMGLLACIGSGLIEFLGSFAAERIRRNTPRAALLSTLAGIAIGFIAMKFALEIFVSPVVGMLPMAIILVTYFANRRMPLGLPGGLAAVLCGTAIAWSLPGAWLSHPMSAAAVGEAWGRKGWHPPQWAGEALVSLAKLSPVEWLGFASVIVPMGLINLVASLQNIESAEAGGDRFDTGSSLAVNGIGTLAAAAFGSCFPTTIYIGHPGWKKLGARAGYSTLNGVVITVLCLTGTVSLVNSLVPLEAGIAIVLWIGLVMTAQAFQASPREHAPAVALGLFPAIAAWGATVMWGAFQAAQAPVSMIEPAGATGASAGVAQAATMQALMESHQPGGGPLSMVNGFLIHGLNLMERGYIFTCMVLSAMAASLIDGRFRAAAVWAAVGALFAGVGLSNSYTLVGNTVDHHFVFGDPPEGAYVYSAWPISAGYLLVAGVCLAFAGRRARGSGTGSPQHAGRSSP